MDGNGHNPTQKGPSSVLTLTITFDQVTGAVGVTGPLQNPLICMGMMEMAKQAIHDLAKEAAKQQRIIPANVMPMIKPA